MARRTVLANALFWTGLALLVGAAGFVLRARLGPIEGLQDLGFIVGGILFVAAAGIAHGGYLLLARRAAARPARWMLAIATLSALLSLVASAALASAALPSANWGLLLFVGLTGLLALAGLAGSPRLWRGRPAP